MNKTENPRTNAYLNAIGVDPSKVVRDGPFNQEWYTAFTGDTEGGGNHRRFITVAVWPPNFSFSQFLMCLWEDGILRVG